jgi:2-haloacid dehalogenase
MRMGIEGVKALAFDVFGTVVDWRGSIIGEGGRLGEAKGIRVDWGEFADAWRRAYQPSMDRVRSGELPWMKLDALHRMALDELLVQFQIDGLSETEKAGLNLVWHRLRPWPDAVAGLARLRSRYILATLSNGNVSLLVEMARHAGLPWDCVLSAEIFGAYKPDPRTYHGAAELLSLDPGELMMVAAHPSDLRAAAACGLRTALVPRPLEWGPDATAEFAPDATFDLVAADFVGLAERLGA